MSKSDSDTEKKLNKKGVETRVFGYARVSTEDQNLDMQIRALEEYGCDRIFQEKKSAYAAKRKQLKLLRMFLQEGDTLVVWKLDRLGRSVSELIQVPGGSGKPENELAEASQEIWIRGRDTAPALPGRTTRTHGRIGRRRRNQIGAEHAGRSRKTRR